MRKVGVFEVQEVVERDMHNSDEFELEKGRRTIKHLPLSGRVVYENGKTDWLMPSDNVTVYRKDGGN